MKSIYLAIGRYFLKKAGADEDLVVKMIAGVANPKEIPMLNEIQRHDYKIRAMAMLDDPCFRFVMDSLNLSQGSMYLLTTPEDKKKEQRGILLGFAMIIQKLKYLASGK